MPSSNWACPICQAAHLTTLTVSEGVINTHRDEHYGEGGSNADVFPQPDGTHRVLRGGNGNRWANREPFNPQPKNDKPWVPFNIEPKWFNVMDGTEVEAPLPDGKGVGLKLSDFIKALDDAPTAGDCDCDEALDPDVDLDPMTGDDLDKACDAGACDHDEERITDEAWRLVMGDRQSAYNHPASDFEATGRMWGAIITNYIRAEGWQLYNPVTEENEPFPDLPPRIVALMIGMVKVSRESHKHKHDNLVDLIGYALCADRIERGY